MISAHTNSKKNAVRYLTHCHTSINTSAPFAGAYYNRQARRRPAKQWRITNRTILITSIILFRHSCNSSPTNLGPLTLSLSLACLTTLRLVRFTISSAAVSDSNLVSSSTLDAATRFVDSSNFDFHFQKSCILSDSINAKLLKLLSFLFIYWIC